MGSIPAVGAPRAVVLALAAGGLAVAGFTLHVAAGAPLTPDGARTLSVALPLIAVGLVIARYQPENRLGTILLVAGLLFSLTLTSVGILRWADDGARVPVLVQRSAFAFVLLSAWPLTTAFVLALGGFPDGTLPSGRWRRWVLVTTGIHGVVAFGSYLTAGSSDLPRYLIGLQVPTGAPLTSPMIHDVLAAANNILLSLLPAWALAGVISRIRRASPVLRQQVKWLIPALGMQLLVHVAFPTSPDPWHGLRAVGEVLVLLSPTVGTVATALAIFRYRLWDIDAVISKGLVFGLLWFILSAAFFAVAYGAALLVGGSDARVLSALAVVLVATFASQGLRRRAESFVRRLVYGDRPGGYAVLAGLAESLRSAGTSEEVGQRILDAVRRGLSVPWATLWLHVESETGGTLQPLATTGAAMATSAPLTSTEADALVQKPASLTSDPAGPLAAPPGGTSLAAFAPLVAKDHLIGVIGCGDRAGDPLMESDLELLGLVAREAALALANQRLEAELRLRLQELQRQADQLRRSRHRLVTAHDDERRRIERDLHDGVQAQLVALTVKLRRQASRSEGLDREVLGALGDEAEAVMFNLQDLARGIYPGVLTDQGLFPALRAQAARIPVDVRLEVDPAITRKRWQLQVEAALYFVALEALGNAQKHAPGSCVTISLHESAGGIVSLQVRDDGPGFEVRTTENGAGRGLQNMADRMNAIGGAVTVTAGGGAGTCVSASVVAIGRNVVSSLVEDMAQLRP